MTELDACGCGEPAIANSARIAAGLTRIPRQLAVFEEHRAAMLRAVAKHPALGALGAASNDDPLVLMLELFAYVADVLSFYDETLAHEAYLRTARLRTSTRKLVALLGYLPRPAVSARVPLLFEAAGARAVRVPRGVQLLSKAVGAEPPQTFEIDDEVLVHAVNNRWALLAPLGTTSRSVSALHVRNLSTRLSVGQPLLVLVRSREEWSCVARVARVATSDGDATLSEITFESALDFPEPVSLASLELWAAANSFSLGIPRVFLAATGGLLASPSLAARRAVDSAFASPNQPSLTLDELRRDIRPGSRILATRDRELRWFRVVAVREVAASEGDRPVTQLVLDVSLNDASRRGSGSTWHDSERDRIVVHYPLSELGDVVPAARDVLTPRDPLRLAERVRSGRDAPELRQVVLIDADERAVQVAATLAPDRHELHLNAAESWEPPLALAVNAHGNVAHASHGETVEREVLGSGDASASHQRFKLAKKPLSYLPAPSAGWPWPLAAALELWVDGERWREVPSLFGLSPTLKAYIVRQDDAGESFVSAGDGVNGARFPTGQDNLVARYRHGAGATSPEAGGIRQLITPLEGLSSVRNPLAAGGGANRETHAEMRRSAPRSALTLGRAISMADMQALAERIPGVTATAAAWHWDRSAQRAAAVVWFVGTASLEGDVRSALLSQVDPSVPLSVMRATSVPATLAIDLVFDSNRLRSEVSDQVRARLLDPDGGFLLPAQLGVGAPLFRSRLLKALFEVGGVEHVRGLLFQGRPFLELGVAPGSGRYFDFAGGKLMIAGKDRTHA